MPQAKSERNRHRIRELRPRRRSAHSAHHGARGAAHFLAGIALQRPGGQGVPGRQVRQQGHWQVDASREPADARLPRGHGRCRRGQQPDVPYQLEDMAKDAVGLLDALGVERAHIAGSSMGGMIAQTVAINHPGRTKSLISMNSTTGRRDLPPGDRKAMAILAQPPKSAAATTLSRQASSCSARCSVRASRMSESRDCARRPNAEPIARLTIRRESRASGRRWSPPRRATQA